MPQNYQRKKSSPVSMNESHSFTSSSCHKKLQQYLDTFLNHPEKYTFPRVQCCSNSTASSDTPASTDTANTAPPTSSRRALYCTDCSKLLIPHDQWPPSIQNGQLDLPFSLDILLSDRRRSSTGFHALVLYHASSSRSRSRSQGVFHNRRRMNSTQVISKDKDKVRLFDLERGDDLPNYHHCAQPQDEQQNQGRQQQRQQEGGTYVLFPSSTSMPLSSVAANIHRLIVLDCKWTKSTSHEKLSAISSLPKVHLDHAPNESFYWRWHNAGPGMISTMEAVYFAAWEVMNAKRRREEEGGEEEEEESLDVLLDWMWLFGIQRAATAQGALQRGKPAPFTLKGKEVQRELRRTEKGSEKHLRDIEQGKRLKEEHKRMVRERNNKKKECVQDI